MSGKGFVKMPQELLESAAWRGLAINTRRLIDFLMIEYSRHAGKANGRLVAPRQQLEAFGIGARHISTAIEDAEHRGILECKRGFGRHPNRYALTWLPFGDSSEPSNRWKRYVSETIEQNDDIPSEGKSLRIPSEGKSVRYPKGSHKSKMRAKTHGYGEAELSN